MAVDIRNIQLGYLDRHLDRVCLLDLLKDVGEGASKLHGLRGGLPVCGIINTWRPLSRLFQQVQDEPRPPVFLGNHHNPVQLNFFPQ